MRGGHGGKGSASFRREPYTPRGGPDGGDGGRGGSVVLEATNDVSDLSLYTQRRRWNAEPGADGAGGRKTGRSSSDLVLKVPVGTIALDSEGSLIADLDRPGARVVAARGGAGGRGNVHFKSSTRHAPDYAEPGLKGEELEILLDLKLIADVGLVGPPNAGKSSVLRALTAAHPKVADYPFTTVAPVLGTVEAPDGRQLTVADVPGLIEGASEGLGLGHEFLAHLERARLLVHVIDVSGDVAAAWRTIDRELAEYGAALDERPQAVVLNKIDLVAEMPDFPVDDPRILRVFALSCATGAGVEDFRRALFGLVPQEPRVPVEPGEELADFLVYRPRPPRGPGFRIFRTDRGFKVMGEAPDEEELEAALRAAGARKGDEVEVGDETLEWA